MKLAELIDKTFKLHNALYISLTQKCPLKCRHCFVESGPERTEAADFDAFCDWVEGIAETPGLEIVFLSGGEPYSHPRALRFALSRLKEAGIYCVVSTSVFWAKSLNQAERMLDRYPHPDCLYISTDIFHEEFVPLDYIKNAAIAARDRNIDVMMQITKTDGLYGEFLERIEQEIGFDLIPESEIYETVLNIIGRAETEICEDLNAGPETKVEFNNSGPCMWLGTPWVHEEGTVCACPNLTVFETENHPLQLGNLNTETFKNISAQTQENDLVQSLRVFGAQGIAENFPLSDWGWNGMPDHMNSICDLCHSITSIPKIDKKVQAHVEQNNLGKQISLLRLYLYGEEHSERNTNSVGRKLQFAETGVAENG